jgi:fucose 4-O-acetylase-like acetyltransferase
MLAKQLYASNEILEKVMVFLGQRTLEIYAIHFYFIGVRYFPSNMMWDCFLASAGAIMLALLISEYLIKPVPIASWLLLGRRSK